MLFNLGLRYSWSNWTGHPNHMTSYKFYELINSSFNDNLYKIIFFKSEINYASTHDLCPLNYKRDYIPGKQKFDFSSQFFRCNEVLYREICIIVSKDLLKIKDVLSKLKISKIFYINFKL